MRIPRVGSFLGLFAVLAGMSGASARAQPLWPRQPTVELVLAAAPLVPSLSAVRLSVPAERISRVDWLKRFEGRAWYLADSPWLFPVSYLEVGVGLRYAWLERRRLLLESGIGTALAVQTLEGALSVPLVVDGLARYALSTRVCLQSELELLLFGQGFAATARVGVRWRPFRFGLLLGADAGYGCVAVWDLSPGGGAIQLALSAGYAL